MSEGDARPGRSIILIAGTSDQRCERVRHALREAGIEVVQVGDVYLGLGEILARASVPPMAVVVQADNLDASELEFFTLAGRLIPGGHVHVFGSQLTDRGVIHSAVAGGATVLEMSDLDEWVQILAEPSAAAEEVPVAAPPRACEQREETPIPAPEDDRSDEPAEPAPEPEAVNEREAGPEPIPAAEAPPEAVVQPSDEPQDEAAAPIPDDATPDVPPETEPPASNVRVARPIEIPGPWGHDPSHEGSGAPGAEDGGPAAAFPWRPSPSRPTRTPPSARAIEHPPLRGPTEVELTREELDALLDDRTNPPDSWRQRR